MAFNDLREFIEAADKLGECRVIEGANAESDIGALTEAFAEQANPPLLLFDKIQDYQPGFRVASNLFSTARRTAMAYGFPQETKGVELVRALKNKIKDGIKLIPPVEVKDAPVKENVLQGGKIDLLKIPTPRWHEFDGGRVIGTGCCCIARDPDEGWVNFGAYRVQVQGKTKVTVQISPNHDGKIIAKKYWAKGKPCPMAISCGQEPLLFAASGWEHNPWGESEYDFTGGLRGEPVQVTKGVATDLPLPATAEIVLEGELMPPEVETLPEGPFGEAFGYYAGGVGYEPVLRIKAILHRNNPILQGNPPSRFPGVWTLGRHFQKAAVLWNQLDAQSPGITGVRMVEDASVHPMVFISVKQAYSGHAKQAALIAAGSSATRNLTFIVVVDDDIDPFNTSEVLWAMATRCDPETQIDIIRGCYAVKSIPQVTPQMKELGRLEESTAIILACKPFHRMNEFPRSTKSSPEYIAKAREKFKYLFKLDRSGS